jgi:hypothetical protein
MTRRGNFCIRCEAVAPTGRTRIHITHLQVRLSEGTTLLRSDSDRLAVGLLGLGIVVVGGMLLGSWQLVLYPTVLMIGVLLAMALVRRPGRVRVPIAVVATFLALFGILHSMGLANPSGRGSVLGWDPMTALYLFVVGPATVLVGLLYAYYGDSDEVVEETLR